MSYWNDDECYFDDWADNDDAQPDHMSDMSTASPAKRKGRQKNQQPPRRAGRMKSPSRDWKRASNLKPGDAVIHDGQSREVDRVVNRSGGGLGTSTVYFKGGGKSVGAMERPITTAPEKDEVLQSVKKILGL